MRPHDADIRLLLELYSDGELHGPDLAKAEALLESDEAAREYVLALEEMRGLVSLPIDEVAEGVRFDGLFERVTAQAAEEADTVRRTQEMDGLVVAYADGQVRDPVDRERVEEYMAAHREAATGFAAVRDLGELVRAPIEAQADAVDFTALAQRIDAALDRIDAEGVAAQSAAMEAPKRSLWSRLLDAVGGPTVFASAATAAAVVFIMLPFTRSGEQTTDPVEIHNHYYTNPAEAVGYALDSIEKGYEADFRPGDKVNDIAPVLWISADGSGDWAKEDGHAAADGSGDDPDAASDTETSL